MQVAERWRESEWGGGRAEERMEFWYSGFFFLSVGFIILSVCHILLAFIIKD